MRQFRGPAFLFLAFTLAGTSVVPARILSGAFGPFLATALSLFTALVFLLPLWLRSLGVLRRLPPRRWLLLALQALLGIFLFRLFLLLGLQRTSAGEAGIMTGATPAVTALFAVFLLKEKPGAGGLAGMACTVAGILLLQGILAGGVPTVRHLGGNLLVLCAAVCEAAFNILSRVFAVSAAGADERLTPGVQTAAVVALALVLSLAPALFEHPARSIAAAGPEEWFALAWYGGAVTALGYLCWYTGIKKSGTLAAAAFSGMMPLMSLALAAALLDERTGLAQWFGGALVTAGMLLVGVPARREPERVPRNSTTTEKEVKQQ